MHSTASKALPIPIMNIRSTLAHRLAKPNPADVARITALCVLLIWSLLTPGFYSKTSILALLTTVSFIGCVAVGMTFITISGNIMSFSIGVTLSAATIVFVSSLTMGLIPAILLTLIFGIFVCGVQGWVIGYFKANPIIVSMAAMALISGLTNFYTGGMGVYPQGNEADVLKGQVGPIPGPLAALLLLTLVGQTVLAKTIYGIQLKLVGSNLKAARAAGIEPWKTAVFAYAIAGLFTAVSAVLIAARYSSGDMQHGIGYDYDAISAVLLGGTAIQGGKGSVTKTLWGALLLASMQGLLLLNGFSTQMQYLLTGMLVLGTIMLQSRGVQK